MKVQHQWWAKESGIAQGQNEISAEILDGSSSE